MLTEEEIAEFKRIYAEEFGTNLTNEEAHDRALEVAALFEIILTPPPNKASSLPHSKSPAKLQGLDS